MYLWDAHELLTGFDLLGHKGSGGGNENYFTLYAS